MEQEKKGGSVCFQRSLILVSHENANSLHYTTLTQQRKYFWTSRSDIFHIMPRLKMNINKISLQFIACNDISSEGSVQNVHKYKRNRKWRSQAVNLCSFFSAGAWLRLAITTVQTVCLTLLFGSRCWISPLLGMLHRYNLENLLGLWICLCKCCWTMKHERCFLI